MQNARAGKRAEKSSRATVALGASRGIIQCDALQIVGIILIAYVILHFIIGDASADASHRRACTRAKK
jgi:hypothetical protein